MATFTIPNSRGEIRQANRSDILGEIVESFNIDLTTSFGKIKSSKTLKKVLDETDDLSSARIQDIFIHDNGSNSYFYIVTNEAFFRCLTSADPTNSANWSEVTSPATLAPASNTTVTIFGGDILYSRDTTIGSWNGLTTVDNDWWGTNSEAALQSGVTHTLHTHRGGQETLFVTDDNRIRYYNSTAGDSTITLQADLVANCVDSGVNAIWVGTYSTSSSKAQVYEVYVGETIDSNSVARNAYTIDSNAVLAIKVVGNVPYIITATGEIQAFNGAGFQTVEELPIPDMSENLRGVPYGDILRANNSRPVHPRGIDAQKRSLFFNFNALVSSDTQTVSDHTMSGVWEYNTETGVLNHRYAFANSSGDNGSKTFDDVGPLLMVKNQYTHTLASAGNQNNRMGFFTNGTAAGSYFVTSEINSGSVQDAYESVYTKAKTLGASDSIVVKYRVEKYDREFADCTAMSANIINTTDTLTNVAVGWEVTDVLTGKVAHITNIDTSTATTSITLDADIATTGDTVRAEFQNWKKVNSTYTSDDGEIKRDGGFGTNPWIQFKVFMTGEIELRQFMAKSNSKQEV